MEAVSPARRAWRRFVKNRPALASAFLLAIVLVLVLLWPWVWPYSQVTLTDAYAQPPSARHPFGTDVLGRDLAARVFYGARISMIVGAVGAVVSLVIGVLWGAVAGYLGGRWDEAMMRIVDILYSLPSIIFVIVLITSLESVFRSWLAQAVSPETARFARLLFLFAGLGAVSWLNMARIVRGEVLTIKSLSFVEASRALGASETRIVLRHILPNLLGIIIVSVTLTVPGIVLYESFLSFLGLGIQPPQASLGSLIAEGTAQINPLRTYWWMLLFPAGLLTLTLLALNLAGDGLRDALDPRSEG